MLGGKFRVTGRTSGIAAQTADVHGPGAGKRAKNAAFSRAGIKSYQFPNTSRTDPEYPLQLSQVLFARRSDPGYLRS